MPLSARQFLLLLLGATWVASSVSLVYVQHLRRSYISEYKSLQIEHERMQVQWGQLQVEASTWAAEDRIERLAVSKLQMQVPVADAVVVVTSR